MSAYEELVEHYNKFSEEKRLGRRHGQVEYETTMRYIRRYVEQLQSLRGEQTLRILDVGAGTGNYAIPLSECGHDVSAVELVPYHVGMLKAKGSKVKAYQGSALQLKRFEEESFDMVLLLGPMYHLFTIEEKVQALQEAKRVLREDGFLVVAYLMNEYSIIVHGFRDGYLQTCVEAGKVDETFHVQNTKEDLYDYVRIEDIDEYNRLAGLERVQMIASTGAANYMRPVLGKMSEEAFQLFLQYHFTTCERGDLMGASSHTVDIVKK